MYYCLSRYYVPEWCRWLNADSPMYLDLENPVSVNLFTYCGNNPVTRVDTNGHSWWNSIYDWANTILGILNPLSTITAVSAILVAAARGRRDDIIEDFKNGCFNIFNQDEEVVIKSNVLSFYKGDTVVRHNKEDSTFSIIGTIWAERGLEEIDFKHEHGHLVQEKILGPRYYTNIAIPSVIHCNFIDKHSENIEYYSTPWKITADILGGVGVRESKDPCDIVWGIAENLLGPVVVLLYYIFRF